MNDDGLIVLQYQSNRYRTMITFDCDHQGQVGELMYTHFRVALHFALHQLKPEQRITCSLHDRHHIRYILAGNLPLLVLVSGSELYICIWSKNFSQSVYVKSEAKDGGY